MTAILLLFFAMQLNSESEFRQVGTVTSDRLKECSGLAMSRRFPGCFWTHNDSGDKPRIYFLNENAKLRGIIELKKIEALDFEDICRFDWREQSWLLIADVGDNQRRRGKKKNSHCRLHLLPEPSLKPEKKPAITKIAPSLTIEFEFEDGRWDCEAVAVDSATESILLITKELPHKCGVYRLPLTANAKGRQTAERIADPLIPFVTGADISVDGQTLVICGMAAGMLYQRTASESWQQSLKRPASIIKLPQRKQGESICLSLDGRSVFVNSEGRNQPLWQVPLFRSQIDNTDD